MTTHQPPSDTDAHRTSITKTCGDCGYEAPALADDWARHEQAQPMIGPPLLVYECPDCDAVVDIEVVVR